MIAYIHDGYTIETEIPADPKWHPAVTITFRPLLHVARVRLLQQIGKGEDAGKGEELAAQAVAKQLVSWSLEHADAPVPISAESVLRLEPHLFARVFSLVAGLEPAAQQAEIEAAKN